MNTIQKIKIKNESNIDKIANNIRTLINERGITESEIANALNMPVMTIRRLASGETTDPRISTLKLIANYFNISVDSLIEDSISQTFNLMPKTTPTFVPILDWTTIAAIKSIKDIDLKNWKEWYPIAISAQTPLSNDVFAIESRPSMQPRFPIGTLLIIDPNESPIDGDIVLIQLKTDGSLSLRELIIDIPKWQLQPIVLGSETIFFDNLQHHFIGVVVLTLLNNRKNK